jgi:hypothetical protein
LEIGLKQCISLSRESAKSNSGDDVAGTLDASNVVLLDGERWLVVEERSLL